MRLLLLGLMLFSAMLQSEEQTPDPLEQLTSYFFAAARTGDLVVLHEFLQQGFPVNQRSSQSYTALMVATYAGQQQAVELLLEHGADACLRDKRGHTAMMAAIVKAEWTLAKILYPLDCKEDQSTDAKAPVTDKNKMTVAQFAEIFGQSDKLQQLAKELQSKELAGSN
ncbi:ankyrin repeat domain-containing protein [Rheinheimera mesophila]|uniref:Ankyrin repeat domain-containing protein n=1 Tax=Rheinheimera mesophila TaxID=1547515 RepID=A0A3P3QGC8_9GAMM|nr:ankyrin repeat domain-containing protein [Rheinheimera mesophila]KKL01291.1 ankyrin [Rheinheimera mesophila]RRJ20194.1 ankyrin repeat domain-containing protein [Rheinheimera mesophila]